MPALFSSPRRARAAWESRVAQAVWSMWESQGARITRTAANLVVAAATVVAAAAANLAVDKAVVAAVATAVAAAAAVAASVASLQPITPDRNRISRRTSHRCRNQFRIPDIFRGHLSQSFANRMLCKNRSDQIPRIRDILSRITLLSVAQ